MDLILGVRVSPEEELQGLDLAEHGTSAYPNFPYIGE
jgi:Amt family ammonium transporter